MTRRTSWQAFGDAASAMVRHDDVADILQHLMHDCVDVLQARAAAVLVGDDRDRLSLLTSSSASATELEMLQAQDHQGPCVDVMDAGVPVVASGAEEMVARWGAVGSAIVAAGFDGVEAFPLLWRGHVIGGLNVFYGPGLPGQPSDPALAQAFADVATIVLVSSAAIPADHLTARVHQAISARIRIEQAKGVLSEMEGIDMERAAGRLQELARAQGSTLSSAAATVLDQARTHPA
jgi:hypothetical protein